MKAADELLGKACKCVKCGKKIDVGAANSQPLKESDGQRGADGSAQEQALPEPCKLIGELLIGDNLITQEQLTQALTVQNKRAGKICEVLLSLGYLDKTKLHNFLSRQSGVPGIDIKNYDIPRDLAELLPEETVKEHLVLPIDKLGKLLTVGMMCPLDTATIHEVEKITGLRVKPMLCRLDDLNTVIQRLYPDKEAFHEEEAPPSKPQTQEKAPSKLSAEDVKKRLLDLDSLPTFSNTVQRVREAVEDPRSSIRQLNDIVRFDPPVVAKLLSVANAGAYGMPGQVKDVALASALLGTVGVCDIVMSSKITGAIVELTSFDYNDFAAVSLFAATAARAIAEKCNATLASVAYTAGLLHDIGRLALAEAFPEAYAGISDSQTHGDLVAAEKDAFGLSHAEAGHLLAQEWALPAEIAESVRDHRSIEGTSETAELGRIVALAAAMAESHKQEGELTSAFLESNRGVLEAMALTDATIEHVYKEATGALAKRGKKR